MAASNMTPSRRLVLARVLATVLAITGRGGRRSQLHWSRLWRSQVRPCRFYPWRSLLVPPHSVCMAAWEQQVAPTVPALGAEEDRAMSGSWTHLTVVFLWQMGSDSPPILAKVELTPMPSASHKTNV